MGIKSIWKSLTSSASQGYIHHAGNTAGARQMREEPLECVSKEHNRDEHLKNLGMKRNKSIRRTIAKKLKRKKDETDFNNKENHECGSGAAVPQPQHSSGSTATTKHHLHPQREMPLPPATSSRPPNVHIETRTSIGSKIEGGTRVEVLTVVGKGEKDLVGETQPLPGHIENEIPRRMDKLRRSIRHSVRKRKESANSEMPRAQKWQLDESAVRAGTCKFYVKYLGAAEVFESRGMQVCEAAVKRLKSERRRTVRGTMFVSGDSIRLVDDDTKALIIDQTIEKVSFCAPDRNFERGFSYISRDGTTRRWMCHAFMAVGDTGERLSHAVGCAFGICLEYKQKRDKANVSVQYEPKDSSFTRNGSFRVGTISERLADPQSMKIIEPPSSRPLSTVSEAENTKAVERPRPTELMYQRQASFRGLGQISGHTPFKRHSRGLNSLRLNDLPSNVERRANGMLRDSPILEDIELPSSNLEENSSKSLDLLSSDDPFTAAEMAAYSGISGSSTPALRGGPNCDSSSTYSTSPPPTLLVPTRLHKLAETPESEMLNPWEHVPDQPVAQNSSSSTTSTPRDSAMIMPAPSFSVSHSNTPFSSSSSYNFGLPPTSITSIPHSSNSLQLHLTTTTNAIQQLSLSQASPAAAPTSLPVYSSTVTSSVVTCTTTSDYSSTPGGYDSSLSSPPSLSDPAAWSIIPNKQYNHDVTAQHLINNIKGSISLDFPKQASTSSGYNSPTSSQHSGSLSNTDWPASYPAQELTNHTTTSFHANGTSNGMEVNSSNFHSSILDELTSNMQSSILEDPFDAEWAAIATRNYTKDKQETANGSKASTNSKNPFISENSTLESFQLHL